MKERREKQTAISAYGGSDKMELREHKSSFMVYLILRILVIVMLVLQVLNQNYENVFLCILTLLLLIVPSFVQVTFKIELPTTLEIIVLFFIFAAEILGEINEFYLLFPVLGHSAAYTEWIFGSGNRVFAGGSAEPE